MINVTISVDPKKIKWRSVTLRKESCITPYLWINSIIMIKLYSSPLQGFTDFRFRNAFQKYFGGVDQYMAPYIRLNGKMEIKASVKRDILPENNCTPDLIPQVITKDAGEFLFVAEFVQNLGYKELNWNLGCPYPMVAKRGMGSG